MFRYSGRHLNGLMESQIMSALPRMTAIEHAFMIRRKVPATRQKDANVRNQRVVCAVQGGPYLYCTVSVSLLYSFCMSFTVRTAHPFSVEAFLYGTSCGDGWALLVVVVSPCHLATCTLHLATCNLQLAPSSTHLQLVTCNLQLATCTPRLATCNLQLAPRARCKLQVTSCKVQVASYKLQGASRGVQVASCKLQVARCKVQGARCKLQVAS
jgi:hypothetical protein